MKNFFAKPFRWAIVFTLILVLTVTYVMLDTFVIPKSLVSVSATTSTATTSTTENTTATSSDTTTADTTTSSTTTTTDSTTSETTDSTSAESASDAVVTENSYTDENISITIDTIEEYDSTIYVADIQVSDVSYLKTALAGGTYGRNIKDTTSTIASENNAIFAINGDYYGFRDYGYVVRNGVLYRDTAGENDALVIDNEGNFSTIAESEISLGSLDLDSIWQVLSFGPTLISDGEIVVDESSEVSQSMTSNPRTAIGQISALHYVVVVSDGRTSESEGLSLLELAQVMSDYGCTTAYNLDGGGSSTMYFNGEVVNNPTDGNNAGEREVSDIVYFGY